MKIAVAGKGGAGKTMITSTLCYIFAQKGKNVYAIDADPNPTLGQALGFPEKILTAIEPVLSLKDLIRERTGTSGSGNDLYGSYFRLNPRVDDLPERCSGKYRSIRLLIMGATRGANMGCACTENTIIKALVSHLILETDDTVIMDMVAGTEHIGRGTASGVNGLVVVVEPSVRSIQAAQSVIQHSRQLGNIVCRIIGNKIASDADCDFLQSSFPHLKINCFLKWNSRVRDAENESAPVYDKVPEIVESLTQFAAGLETDQGIS